MIDRLQAHTHSLQETDPVKMLADRQRDTGWRDMKTPVVFSDGRLGLWIRMRRIGNIVHVDWSTTWAWIRYDTGNRCKVPEGFHPPAWNPDLLGTDVTGTARLSGTVDTWETWNGGTSWTQGNWAGAGYPRRELAHDFSVIRRRGDPTFQPEGGYVYLEWFSGNDYMHAHGSGSYVTDDPWPTTLPGTPI